ncbi:MAG: Gldg family protein [Planctomycetes bacterium]|nr:Gldg family protein [Planctomycetota bacterium]
MNNRATLFGSVLLLIALFVAVNMLCGFGLRGARIDATQGSIYTLTKGSRNIAQSPEEPIKLTFYYSGKLAQGKGQIATYAQRVRETLEEYARVSNGKIILKVVDPEPFTEAEDEAVKAGVQGVPVSAAGENLYFGLVGTNTADGKETIPFFDSQKEKFLEYDLSKLINSLASPKKKVVGLISTLQLEGGFTMDPQTRQPRQTPPWYIANEIKAAFELRSLGKDCKAVPDDISVLMVMHPKGLSDATLYAIDQFVMKGGRAVFFVDPNADADREQPPGGMPPNRSSNLDKLLNAWGVEVVPDVFAADFANAVRVTSGRSSEPVLYLAYLQLKPPFITKDDPITGQAEMINFATPGVIKAKPIEAPKKDGKEPNAAADAPTPGLAATITPLAKTSDRAMMMPTAMIMGAPDPKALLKEYVPGSEALTIAARLGGRVHSAFPTGRPAVEGEKPEEAAKASAGFLSESKEPINVVLFADTDVAADFMWVRLQEFLGRQLAQKFGDNGDVIMNALDNLSGSNDLIAVRARQESSRPFTRVEQMQKEADQKFQKEQQDLEKKVEETQRKIGELQANKQGQDAFVLTPEQKTEIEKLQREYAETRKQLRVVKSSLRHDIEMMGTKLKFINIGLIPLLVSVAAVGLGAYRVSRRRVKTAD